jgi:biopolymer transport protein ExbD
MIAIERQKRRAKSIPLISLIDVVFQLLIYFMLTTSFTRSESLEMLIPGNESTPPHVTTAKPKDSGTLHVYLEDDGKMLLEERPLDEATLVRLLHDYFALDPERGVLVSSAEKVSVGQLVKAMDRIYTAGGKNIAVAEWTRASPAASLR